MEHAFDSGAVRANPVRDVKVSGSSDREMLFLDPGQVARLGDDAASGPQNPRPEAHGGLSGCLDRRERKGCAADARSLDRQSNPRPLLTSLH